MTKTRSPHHMPALIRTGPAVTPADIFIVEDERIVAEDIQSRLKHLGYRVVGAISSGETAIQKAGEIRPDLVLMDIRLAGPMDGIEAAESIRVRFDIPVVFLTAHADDRTLELAKRTEPFGYVLKPFDDRELHTSIEMALYKHRAGQSLRESESRFREIAETAAALIFLYRGDQFIYANPFMLTLTGYTKEELYATKFWEIVHPDFRETVRERGMARQRGETVPRRYEVKILKKNGEECWLDFSSGSIMIDGKPAALGTALDITRRKRAEEERNVFQAQLVQARKMESIGNLVVGLAHNFNNILAIILGYASRLERGGADPSRIGQSVAAIEKAVQRGAGLIQQLIGVTQKANLQVGPVDLNALIEELSHILGELFPNTITFVRRLDRGLPMVAADKNQMQQALMNLCLNGAEAMSEGGILTITTETVPGSALRGKFPNPRMGPYARVIITDTGRGIDRNLRDRIFEPFFTTKDRAVHPGLGLAMVYGIVASHQGLIDVDTGVSGTTFDVYFPAESTSRGRSEELPEATERGSPESREGILVIEPEEMIRGLAHEALTNAGYAVVAVSNAEEGATWLAAERETSIRLVLMDLGLVEASGTLAFEDLRSIDPSLRIVFSVGYGRADLVDDLLKRGVHGIIRKPYRVADVLAVVRSVLDGKPPEMCIQA